MSGYVSSARDQCFQNGEKAPYLQGELHILGVRGKRVLRIISLNNRPSLLKVVLEV